MIDFIWHLRGSFELPPEDSNDIIIDRLETFLEKQHKPIIDQTDTSITFDSPLWSDLFTPNWLALVIYDKGKLSIEQQLDDRYLRYELRSFHGFIFCLAAGLLFFAFAGTFEGVTEGAKIGLTAFAWLYGANIALALVRVPMALRKAARGS